MVAYKGNSKIKPLIVSWYIFVYGFKNKEGLIELIDLYILLFLKKALLVLFIG